MPDIVAWLSDPNNWSGDQGIPTRLIEHLQICLLAVGAATAIGLPVGLYVGHTGRHAGLAINLANIGRAVPSYALMVAILPIALTLAPTIGYDPDLGLTFLPLFLAMTLLAIPPILVATYAGLREVDRDLIEAGRGMGLTERQILGRLEVPLAVPVIIGGFRTSTLQVIATATIGAILSFGGLGRFIVDGLANRDDAMLFGGAVLVTALALIVDGVLAVVQHVLTPRALRGKPAPRRPSDDDEDRIDPAMFGVRTADVST